MIKILLLLVLLVAIIAIIVALKAKSEVNSGSGLATLRKEATITAGANFILSNY